MYPATCVQNPRDVSPSNRPLTALFAYLLVAKMEGPALTGVEAGEPVPDPSVIAQAKAIVAEIPTHLIRQPDVTPFYGEVHVSWRNSGKQVVLMTFPNRPPLVHHHPSQGEPSIEGATSAVLQRWLVWLNS